MRALGDKIAASILAQTARVSSIPWSGDGITCDPKVVIETGAIPPELFRKAMVTTEEECIAAAERIGYPVMLKASEGGGGKGIRMSKDAAELRNNFVQVTNEVPGALRRPFRRHRRDAVAARRRGGRTRRPRETPPSTRRGACSQQQTHARTTRRLAHVPHAVV